MYSPYSDQSKDSEILQFIKEISDVVKTWKTFHLPLKDSGYVYFNVQGIEKYGYQFLDRIILTEPYTGKQHRGTIIGEYEGKLYTNLDTHFYAQAVMVDEKNILPI